MPFETNVDMSDRLRSLLEARVSLEPRAVSDADVPDVEYECQATAGAAGLATDIVEWQSNHVRECRSYGL